MLRQAHYQNLAFIDGPGIIVNFFILTLIKKAESTDVDSAFAFAMKLFQRFIKPQRAFPNPHEKAISRLLLPG